MHKKADIDEAELVNALMNLHSSCRIVLDNSELFLTASYLRNRYSFSYWDSLIVAAALNGNCSTIYTEDMQHGQIIENTLTIINPFQKM